MPGWYGEWMRICPVGRGRWRRSSAAQLGIFIGNQLRNSGSKVSLSIWKMGKLCMVEPE